MRYRTGTPGFPLYITSYIGSARGLQQADDTVPFNADSGHERRPGETASRQEDVSPVMVDARQRNTSSQQCHLGTTIRW